MRWRNIALILSIVVTAAAIALVATRGLNFGVDFVGGQSVRVAFVQPPPIERLREQIAALDVGEASIQESRQSAVQQAAAGNAGQANLIEYTISLPLPPGGEAAAARGRGSAAMIESTYPRQCHDPLGRHASPARCPSELLRSGAWAIALAMLGIAIFIWIRFEWQFGVGALVTLFHDVWMTLGFFSLTRLEFDLNVVAAILTIVGYSLNDTVVIYDRIRENLRKYRKMEIVAAARPLAERDAVAHHGDLDLDPARARRAADPRAGRDLRADHRHLHRHLRRHLFVHLHLFADPGLARREDVELPARRERRGLRPAQRARSRQRPADDGAVV